jgi:hypothetical protein
MPPRADMVTRADLGYKAQQGATRINGYDDHSHSSFDVRHHHASSKQLLPANKPRRRKRIVNFNSNIVTIEVEHMDDLPGEDIWYSRDEYDEIKSRNSQIVRLIKAGEFEENDDLSCRGLEHKLKEVFRQRRANKFNALNAVLEEQDRQINRGMCDQGLISVAYQTVSVRCQESANTIAFRDYKFSFCYDPNTPATGKNPYPMPSDNKDDDTTSVSVKGGKKKKKKDKKEKKDKHHHHHAEKENDDDESLSPKGEKKKGVKRVVHSAKRIMRRMSM